MLIPKVSWQTLRDHCLLAERLGFDHAWVDDHLTSPADPAQDWLEAWSTLAALATATTTIRLGSLVSSPVVRHPALLARQALTVERISQGRLEVGLGSGYADSDHALAGSRPWPGRERAERFREAVALLDRVLRGEPVEPGRYYRSRIPPLGPRPMRSPRPPLTVAAHGPHAMATAARYGDAWSTFGGFGLSAAEHLDRTARQVRRMERACEEAGRDPATLGRTLLTGRPLVSSENMWAGPDAFASFVSRYRAAGIDRFVFYWPPQDYWPDDQADEDTVRRIVTDVIPALRNS
ncbi:LLM class flavin-dependent oxidoreductase [Nonomuraea sp. C10]|uniref:LLM class flavin-dependent oxidoreductase n=1 Tax=Nonomuraea sp. C10 TaxID=2600577 RepID=UPI0011CD468C|nr:LLM class flavin-dependent oxidoreductase [Nonomuraea sp. C10]TXK38973.1 LLM class flavin-dependent oxidoreductase [Nonomuraea sp. C10]